MSFFGLRLLCGDQGSSSPATDTQLIHLQGYDLGVNGAASFCEVLAEPTFTGVYDTSRQFLSVPCAPTAKLSQQPEEVQALVSSSSGAQRCFFVVLVPPKGPVLMLPRDGAPSPSLVRVRPLEDRLSATNVVAVARGSDPCAAFNSALKALQTAVGMTDKEAQAYVVPLLDGVNRLRYDTALASVKGAGTKGADSAAVAAAYEQQLHEGILVQAGPDCPAKPLLQAPGLRLCQGLVAPLGLRYSGMSVVYGSATGHVLAVMDTTAALKMAPPGSVRSAAAGLLQHSSSSSAVCVASGSDSPAAVSAGVSDTTSTTPSPSLSRANSCEGSGAEFPAADSSPIATTMPASSSPGVAPSVPLVKVLSGRSITTAPVIQVLAASANESQRPSATTPTGAPAQVLVSFAVVGIKSSTGRDGSVQCCRIMPASSLVAAAAAVNADSSAPGPKPRVSGLGLAVQLEVASVPSGTLLMFVEGPEDEEGVELHGAEDLPVRRVAVDGQPARWRYDSTGGMLSVDLPLAPALGAARLVHVFM